MSASPKNESEKEVKSGLPPVVPDGVEQDHPERIDDAIPTHTYSLTPMVGLGASAGGIPALLEFFRAMPPDPGMTFVVILHLAPDHESTLPQVLARATTMRVLSAKDGVEAEANTVYVIPPGKYLTANDGHLSLTPMEPERGKRVAVDLFFRSMADSHGAHAISIVLSGADGDGANGLKRIKERGGLTIAQDPTEAETPGMPQSAINTGMVDWVLRVADMPKWVLEYQARERRLKVPAEHGALPEPARRSETDDDESALREVLIYLHARTGRVFIGYKRATVVRRLSRRMQINAVETLGDYLAFLRMHPGEAAALLQDLLISVTNFFRDRDAFEAVEALMPRLFKGKTTGDAVRIWVPACATGEEAYTMAMLALEHARTLEAPPSVQVFGCDLDDGAIQVARAGLYPETISADVSEERLRRFFVKEHRGYHVRREVREVVLFASHDLLKDAPFSRMDLISCRNLMIYLGRDMQDRVLGIFHFALRPEGLLFLGTTESVPEGSSLFSVLDKRYRIYTHIPGQRPGLPLPSATDTLIRVMQKHINEMGSTSPVLPERSFSQGFGELLSEGAQDEDKISVGDLHFKLLERLAPPSIVVDKDHTIMHLSESAGRFLQLAGGAPNTNLLRLVHPSLRVELRTALFQAAETDSAVVVTGVPVELDQTRRTVDMRVSPSRDLAPGYFLILFEMREAVSGETGTEPQRPNEPEPIIRRLEREAEGLKGRLRNTVEQYEATCEELKASNEELQAMNEELRSASEELETSREELQSINEELTTVNQELKGNLEELSHANSDMRNFMASTAIATLFLDREFRIMRYTPSAVALFRLIPSDVGRPLADLNHLLDYAELREDVERVLTDLVPIEREVCDTTSESRCYLARLLPYRTLDDHIGGVVLTLVDVTDARRASKALAMDLADTQLLQKVSGQLIQEGNVEMLYRQILEAAVAVMRSDMGSLQIFYPERNALRLLASKGLHPRSMEFWDWVAVDSRSVCSQSMQAGTRVITPDVELCPFAAGSNDLEQYRLSKIRAVQSTPLIARNGSLVGMISTQWHESHVPADRDLRLLDVLARQTADLIERRRAEDVLRASEARQAFLLKLGDCLRSAIDSTSIETTAVTMVGEALKLDCVFLSTIDLEADATTVLREWTPHGKPFTGGTHKLSSFGAPLVAAVAGGRTMAVADVTVQEETRAQTDQYAAMDVRAFVCVPLIRRGVLTRILGAISTAPREWHPDQVTMLEEAAERTWDAVERARAVEGLRASEEKYRTLFNSLDEGVLTLEVLFDEEGRAIGQRHLESNPALTRMTGMSASAISQSTQEVMPGLETTWLQTCGHVALTGEPMVLEHPVQTLGKNWFEVRCLRIGQPDSRIVVAVFNDITARKQAELTLRASEARKAFLLKLSDALHEEGDASSIQFKAVCVLGEHLGADRVGFAEAHEDGESMVVTRAYAHDVPGLEGSYRYDDYGKDLARKFLSGDPVVRNDIANDPTMTEAERQAQLALNLAATVNVPLVKNGTLRAVLFVHFTQPHEWTAAELTIIRDVAERTCAATERARAEARLAESLRETQTARGQAEIAAKAKDDFLAVLSHELRTPLTPVLMGVEMLSQTKGLSPASEETLQMIQRNVEIEMRLIDDLLDVTRISCGKLEIMREEGDLHETLRHAAEVCRADIEAKNQTLEFSLKASNHHLSADFGRLQQAFWNLLKNASKFTPAEGHITLTSRDAPHSVVVEILDTGIGIEPEALARIMNPFEQAGPEVTREYGGLGLGLAICKATVEAHGGTLTATSPGHGQGATFTVVLPLI